jgi:hypothetical protein
MEEEGPTQHTVKRKDYQEEELGQQEWKEPDRGHEQGGQSRRT